MLMAKRLEKEIAQSTHFVLYSCARRYGDEKKFNEFEGISEPQCDTMLRKDHKICSAIEGGRRNGIARF